jgi:AraC family transcriptional regulator of adaptative response/methylated-DNA-[protein]-cysteine methyltransferase
MKTLPSSREMERAMRGRDASYDGIFFVAVKTTGVFCRPVCPARKPLSRNAEYFPTVRAAIAAGYRPCRRCRPLDPGGRPPEWVGRLLSAAEKANGTRLHDADLRSMDVDPVRARRWFRRHYDMTFHDYARSVRLGRALQLIRSGDSPSGVGYDTGFESQSGFRDAFVRLFGAPPGQSRRRDCIVCRLIESPLGALLACATEEAVCLLEFTDRRSLQAQVGTMRKRFALPVIRGNNEVLKSLSGQLSEYFAGRRQAFDVPLMSRGTPFQESVWKRLRRIPYGKTLSYKQLARDIGSDSAQRAVGTANGRNPIVILIPCHRVVNDNGALGGYGGGLWRKRFLLDLERGAADSSLQEARTSS